MERPFQSRATHLSLIHALLCMFSGLMMPAMNYNLLLEDQAGSSPNKRPGTSQAGFDVMVRYLNL